MPPDARNLMLWSGVGFIITVGMVLLISTVSTPKSAAASRFSTTPTPWFVYLPVITQHNSAPTPTVTDGRASWSSPIAVSPDGQTVWVVNPDAGSVTALDAGSLDKVAEVAVGQEPWSLAVSPDGAGVYVLDRAAGTLVILNAATYTVAATLPLGPEATGIALTPGGSTAYITLRAAGMVAVVDLIDRSVIDRVAVEPHPYAIAVTDDGDGDEADEQIVVTHFLAFPRPGGAEATDDGRVGRVTRLSAANHAIIDQITLAPDDHGFPNLLAGISLAGEQAWLPHVRAAPDLPAGLTTTVFAAVAVLDLTSNSEALSRHLPLNDQEIFGSPVNDPVAAIPSPDGSRLYVVLAGSDLVEVVDIAQPDQPQLVRFLPTGKNPRGLALSPDGQRGFVMNYLSRSVTVLDLEQLEPVAEAPVTGETLSPAMLRGKILFNNATDPKLSQGSWISCASCHPDGGTDGVTWMFPDGPRQTPPLWNAAATRPWHWSAALDEAQDVEETIDLIQHGLGLAPGADPPLLGPPNAGRSADLDALALFLDQGIRPAVPPLPPEDVTEGRLLFESAGCTACHGGPHWTASALPGLPGSLDPDGNGMVDAVLRAVGTLNPRDLRGAAGFDPPSLLGVGLTGPYLHDGSMLTLEDLLASGHPDPEGGGNGLNSEDVVTLAKFLRSIGPETAPIE